jgi:hypothetical protein
MPTEHRLGGCESLCKCISTHAMFALTAHFTQAVVDSETFLLNSHLYPSRSAD